MAYGHFYDQCPQVKQTSIQTVELLLTHVQDDKNKKEKEKRVS